jgi:DNA-binding transcriptional ArsR family regulator
MNMNEPPEPPEPREPPEGPARTAAPVARRDLGEFEARAADAAEFLKTLANKHRLMILCALVDGERSVGQLVERLGISQPNTSQHLLRLKSEGLISTRRDGATIYYRLANGQVAPMIQTLHGMFCPPAR